MHSLPSRRLERVLHRLWWALAATIALGAAGCASGPAPGEPAYRRAGDEIMVCGQLFHTGAPVVLWTDPGGYDAYRVEKRFVPLDKAGWAAMVEAKAAPDSPNRYGLRREGLTPQQLERVRGGGWDLPLLQDVVDQFVIHYDVCGTSRTCFRVLHDVRGLSVHFMLDIDGTIYQTMDLKERAWHATTSNDRSVGVEIANIGAYGVGKPDPFNRWYVLGPDNRMRIAIPPDLGDGGVRTPGFLGHPARDTPVVGEINGQLLRMYDLTAEQYSSLVKLTATLCTVFPKLACDAPRDERGGIVNGVLLPDRLKAHRGLIGHYHITKDKIDPGPAFQWERVVGEARAEMRTRRQGFPASPAPARSPSGWAPDPVSTASPPARTAAGR